MRRVLLAGAGILLAVVCGFLGYQFARQRAENVTATTATGVQSSVERPIPGMLPEITLEDREGQARALSHWKGQPLLINFWATWCEPCRKEIPLLKRLRAAGKPQNLEVIGVAVDAREAVLEYAKAIGMDYPLLIGEEKGYEAASAFGVPGVLPFSVFADSQGRILTMKVGELHEKEAVGMLDALAQVEAKRLTLEQARERLAQNR